MSTFEDRMAAELSIRRYSRGTKSRYLWCLRAFLTRHERGAAADARAFLLFLVERRRVGSAGLKMHVASLKFFFRFVRRQPRAAAALRYPRVPRGLPTILGGTEVQRLLDTIRIPLFRAMVLTAYGTGMRIGELCALEGRDVDPVRGLIHVRRGKGGRDRYVFLPEQVLQVLRECAAGTRGGLPRGRCSHALVRAASR